jgi:hypothetical protein
MAAHVQHMKTILMNSFLVKDDGEATRLIALAQFVLFGRVLPKGGNTGKRRRKESEFPHPSAA